MTAKLRTLLRALRSRRVALVDHRMADGSRNFATIPWLPCPEIERRLQSVPGVTISSIIDTVTETWVDFEFRGYFFSIHNPLNEFELYVKDPGCPDAILCEVVRRLS